MISAYSWICQFAYPRMPGSRIKTIPMITSITYGLILFMATSISTYFTPDASERGSNFAEVVINSFKCSQGASS